MTYEHITLLRSIAAGVGLGATAVSAEYASDTDGAQTLLAAVAYARVCIGVVEVIEEFADDEANAQPVFVLGDGDDDDKFITAAVLDDAALGSRFAFAGVILANEAFIVTGTPGAGAATGAIRVTIALALASEELPE